MLHAAPTVLWTFACALSTIEAVVWIQHRRPAPSVVGLVLLGAVILAMNVNASRLGRMVSLWLAALVGAAGVWSNLTIFSAPRAIITVAAVLGVTVAVTSVVVAAFVRRSATAPLMSAMHMWFVLVAVQALTGFAASRASEMPGVRWTGHQIALRNKAALVPWLSVSELADLMTMLRDTGIEPFAAMAREE